ncbi:hypothetical protein PG997_004740 [Apiospora hydei]|uniref:RING-type domain-containing protein n=1 Tax=Apiospora hydei TaxID=1337664 RepID=A0ABR1X368_9PEZI
MASNTTENCGICQENAIDAPATLVTLPCAGHHAFHPDCIKQWLGCGHTLAAEHIQPGSVIDSTVIAGPCKPNCGGPVLSRTDQDFMTNYAPSTTRLLISIARREAREAAERRRDLERQAFEERRHQAALERFQHMFQDFVQRQEQVLQRELREMQELRGQLDDDENEQRELSNTFDTNEHQGQQGQADEPVPRQRANHPVRDDIPELMNALSREVRDLLLSSIRRPGHSRPRGQRTQPQQQEPPQEQQEESLLLKAFGPNVMELPTIFADSNESANDDEQSRQ